MNPAELLLVQDGLKMADDALTKLMQVDNANVKHIANLLHSVVVFGEMFLGVSVVPAAAVM